MKRLSERLAERLKGLDAPVEMPTPKLRLCASCDTHKPYKLPYWETGKRKCRHCDRWGRH